MTPRRPTAPGVPGQRPSSPGSGRARPASPPSGRARAGSAPVSRSQTSSRPRPASAGRADSPRAGLRAGTGKPLWALGAVGVVLALLILPYFQKWLIQRSEIESARVAVSQSRQDVAALTEQQARWQDDDYVKAQARARLHYVMPGETGFVVVDPHTATLPPTGAPSPAATVPTGQRPWFADVWLSAQVAADPSGTGTGK